MWKNKLSELFRILLMVIMAMVISLPMVASANTNSISQDKPGYQLDDGVTEPIYSYSDAIKETIYVKTTLDSDHDGEADNIAIDIMRPKETERKSTRLNSSHVS